MIFGRLGRLWPIVVMGAGLCFVVPPFMSRGKRGLGALFIPGLPVLTTGAILFLASVFNAWGIWEWLWPMLIISLAMGFVFAAIYMRNIWLLIPAGIIVGNGLLFTFYAITDWWRLWAILWPLEPLWIGSVVLFTLWLAGQGDRGRQVARHLARTAIRPLAITIPIVVVLGAIFG